MAQIEIADEQILELTILAYDNWELKKQSIVSIKNAIPDYNGDTGLYKLHQDKIRTAVAEEIKARLTLHAIRKYCHV